MMPRSIEPVQTTGPYVISVTVTTGDGETRNDVTISSEMGRVVSNLEALLEYEAAKQARRGIRNICRLLVLKAHPNLRWEDKELGLIWRATLMGKPITVQTELDVIAENNRTSSWRFKLWLGVLNLWLSIDNVMNLFTDWVTQQIDKLEPGK